MAIAVGNVGTPTHTVSSGDITPTLPTHSEGDLLLGFACRRSSTVQTPTLTASAGWTKLVEYADRTMVVWGKIATASESNPTFTHDNTSSSNPWIGVVMQVTEPFATIGSIVHTNTSGRADASTSTVTFDAMTITSDGVLLVDFCNCSANRTFTPTGSPAYTEQVDYGTTDGNDSSMFIQTRVQTTASSTSSHTATASSTAVQSTISLALLPAAGGIAAQIYHHRKMMGAT